VLLDAATVGGDGDEVRLRAIVVAQPLNQLTGISGVVVVQVRIDDLCVQYALELLLRPEPLAAVETHAHDRVRRLVQQLAHRVERELAGAMDPHLLARPAVEGREHSRRRGAVLAAFLEIRLGLERLLDGRHCCGHGGSPSGPRVDEALTVLPYGRVQENRPWLLKLMDHFGTARRIEGPPARPDRWRGHLGESDWD
jgi:hypothetical protein